MIEIEGTNDSIVKSTGSLSKMGKQLTVGQLERALLLSYPQADAESWDRMGMLAGDPAASVTGVAIALDATCDAVEKARRAGANVLLTHHPAFLDAPGVFSPTPETAGAAGAVVFAAISARVALMNVHTALDASRQASRLFPQLLSLEYERVLAPLAHDDGKGYGSVCAVRPPDKPFKLAHLAARATSVFGFAPRVWGDFDVPVERVAIANGSASDFVEAAVSAKADCLVCGEIRYHTALSASEQGLAVIELGHDVSEFPLCALLAQAAVAAGVPQERIVMVDQSAKWRYPDSVRV